MDLKSFITVVMIINSVAFITPANAADEILSCNHDSDCSVHQYCYQVSNQCVNYTSCIRWNRLEGKKQAQSASQCGPCIPGYQAEILVTGIPEAFCKKVTHIKKETTDVPYSNNGKLSIWIYIAVGIILLLLVVLFSILLVKKRGYIHGNKKWFRQIGSWNFSPTAPPPDGAIYLPTTYYADDEPPIYSSVMNNNNNNKDKNRLVRAVPCHPPDWVDNDPNYGHDDPDTSANTTTSTTTNVFASLQVEDEDTTPSVWTPEEVTVQVPARAFHQFGTEQRDNVLNTVLVRGECLSNSETSEETGPTPSAQTSNSRNNNDNYRGPSVQINQMITLNMVNNDN
ncbi:uncharacterized protein LOC130673939 isoform X1 [Microplitis mediator]|uniref:uncharacterized protein LOC130673939 isoform X1 n=2 Tax=Microplitis mediator TaxID=375433 RepID=UPI0025574E4B|nr:uncharacterized protein LOC130673939 isoform X1 [Microplitis mediator]